MDFYIVSLGNSTSIEHSWDKVHSIIHKVPGAHCQRIDNKPRRERWINYVEEYCDENKINIFKSMIKDQRKSDLHFAWADTEPNLLR